MRNLERTLLLSLAVLPIALLFSAEPPGAVIGPEYSTGGQLKFPEHYREWIFLSSGVGMTYGPIAELGRNGPPMFDNIFVNPDAYRSFLETGHWPDKTILVMESRYSESHASINNGGHFQTDVVGVEAGIQGLLRAIRGLELLRFYRGSGQAPDDCQAGPAHGVVLHVPRSEDRCGEHLRSVLPVALRRSGAQRHPERGVREAAGHPGEAV